MSDEDTVEILIATDNHLGYKEKDSVCENDSFVTFEEVFTIAKERNVDFVILGGDLFHENKPSRKTLHSCMEIFRKHCLGSRPSQVEIVSDQAVDFGHTSRTITSVNYEDPNMNIAMPVFSVHGNHDDPAGSGGLSAIDLLSVAGLLNHFGKTSNLETIQISPVLLQKGKTKIALYGLGSIRDERLHRLFVKKKVEFLRPKEDTGSWFNIMVIHQNRAQHGQTNYIPEQFLDDFFDLVIWGHEHECLIEPQWNSIKNFFVIQPGSSVATSLSPGESKKKHVAVLSVRGREMKTDPIPLQTVRNMYIEDIVLSQISCISLQNQATLEEDIQDYCEERVTSLIGRARRELSGHPKQPKKPLIRLRIDYTGDYPTFNPHRLAGKFQETVANADSIIHFMKKSTRSKAKDKFEMSGIDDMIISEVVDEIRVEDLVEEYLNTAEKKSQMALLSAKGLSLAVREFVENKERDAISDLCNYQLEKVSTHLKQTPSLKLEQDAILQLISGYKEERKVANMASAAAGSMDDDGSENEENIHKILDRFKQSRIAQGVAAEALNSDDDVSLSDKEPPPTTKPRGGRGVRGSKGTTRGRVRGRGTRGRRAATKTPVAVVEAPSNRKSSGNIMDAFKAASQRVSVHSNKNITEILESDEEDTETTFRGASITKPKLGSKRGRGVDFSSDDESPIANFLASSKRRR